MGWREWPGKLSRWVLFRGPPAAPARKLRGELAAVKADRDHWKAWAERLEAQLKRKDELAEEQRTEIRKLQADVDVLTHTVEGQAKTIVAQQELVDMVAAHAAMAQTGDRTGGRHGPIGGGYGG